jgi:hypothetical protein
MRRLIAALGAATAGILLVLSAGTAQAATIGPEITWSGVTASPTGPLRTCQIAPQTVTFRVTGLTGNAKAKWRVTAFGETNGKIVVTLPLGTVTKTDNGVTESVTVGPDSAATWPQGPVLFFVHLFDPSGNAVVTAGSATQDCT